MRVVIALGDSAFLQRDQPLKVHLLQKSIQRAARAVAEVASVHQTVILHNNGPQIGLLTLMHGSTEELSLSSADVIGAQSRGLMGLTLEQTLRNSMPGHPVCSLINLTVIDSNDPALMKPSLPSGPIYTHTQAQLVQEQNPGWTLIRDGRYYRRLIASPEPREILELPVLQKLMTDGHITVVCGSGGGLPVCRDADDIIHGVEAVVNQDKTAALIAREIDADALLLLSATEAIQEPSETILQMPIAKEKHNGEAACFSRGRAIKAATPEKLAALRFNSSSIESKVSAARLFVGHRPERNGRICAIGSLFKAMDVLSGKSGTRIATDTQDSIAYY